MYSLCGIYSDCLATGTHCRYLPKQHVWFFLFTSQHLFWQETMFTSLKFGQRWECSRDARLAKACGNITHSCIFPQGSVLIASVCSFKGCFQRSFFFAALCWKIMKNLRSFYIYINIYMYIKTEQLSRFPFPKLENDFFSNSSEY